MTTIFIVKAIKFCLLVLFGYIVILSLNEVHNSKEKAKEKYGETSEDYINESYNLIIMQFVTVILFFVILYFIFKLFLNI